MDLKWSGLWSFGHIWHLTYNQVLWLKLRCWLYDHNICTPNSYIICISEDCCNILDFFCLNFFILISQLHRDVIISQYSNIMFISLPSKIYIQNHNNIIYTHYHLKAWAYWDFLLCFWIRFLMLIKAALFDHKYSKNLNKTFLNIITIKNNCLNIFFLIWKNWIFSIHYSSFRVTWHYHYWKQMCCSIFLWKPWYIFFYSGYFDE